MAEIEYTGDQLGSATNAVKAEGPFGQREFLRRLVCPDGSSPAFERYGSFGPGPDRHTVDGYDVACVTDGIRALIFMDMYHPGYRERSPLPPFEVLAELPARSARGCPPRVHADADSSARYVFDWLEVETPARLLNPIAPPPDIERSASFSFVVSVDGVPELESLVYPSWISDEARAEALRIVAGLEYNPALHSPSCPVRSRTGLRLPIHREPHMERLRPSPH